MMTHLHVKSTEPKAAPQPVSTELYIGGRNPTVSLLCFPPQAWEAGQCTGAAVSIKGLECSWLFLGTFQEEGGCKAFRKIEADSDRWPWGPSSSLGQRIGPIAGYDSVLWLVTGRGWKSFQMVWTQKEDSQTLESEEKGISASVSWETAGMRKGVRVSPV